LGKALKYFEEGISLFKYDSYNANFNIGTTYGQIGDLYYQRNELESAIQYYKKSVETLKKLRHIWHPIGGVFDGLIKISINQGNLVQAKEYLESLKSLNEQNNYKLNHWYKISKTRLLKSESRFQDWIEAQKILKKLIENPSFEKDVIMSPINTAIIELCDFLLKELQLTNNPIILNEIRSYIDQLQNNSRLQDSYSLISETKLLKAKLALIDLNLEDARKLLFQAQTVAENHDLFILARKISAEHDILLSQSDLWQEFKRKNTLLSERVRLAEVDDVFDRLKKKSEIKPPELDDELSVLILIMNQGGSPLFSYPFSDEWKFDDDLFGGFLTAFNSISDEIFSEGLDRVKFGNQTVLIEPIKNFSVCYLFKGQTYPAKQRLSKFIERLQVDSATMQTFDKFSKTSQVAELHDIPIVKNLLIEIFKI
jgi:tetratricopeptide (TPR) repeat protein